MILRTWGEVLTESFQDLWLGVMGFVPNLVVAIIIFVAGWIVGALLGRLVAQIIKALKVDTALRGAGLETIMNRAGFRLNSGLFLAISSPAYNEPKALRIFSYSPVYIYVQSTALNSFLLAVFYKLLSLHTLLINVPSFQQVEPEK